MSEAKKQLLLRDVEDKMCELEQKAAFIAMAISAIALLDEDDFYEIQSRKTWEGLSWYIIEIERELREINAKM